MAEMVIGDFWNVTRSQVYRELRTLEGLGLVSGNATGTRERKPYVITDEGRLAFELFIHGEPGPDLLRSPLLLMVFFGTHIDPVRRKRFLAIHRLRHEQALDEYRRVHHALEPTEVDLANVLQYAILHEEAVLRWFEWMADHGDRVTAHPQELPAVGDADDHPGGSAGAVQLEGPERESGADAQPDG